MYSCLFFALLLLFPSTPADSNPVAVERRSVKYYDSSNNKKYGPMSSKSRNQMGDLGIGGVSRPLTKLKDEGGPNGTEFDDLEQLHYIIGVHSFSVSFTDKVDSIAVAYTMSGGLPRSAAIHGKPSNTSINVTLGLQEHIFKIEGSHDGQYVKQLIIKTRTPENIERTYGPYGEIGSNSFSFSNYVVAFYGRCSDSLNSIGVYGLENVAKSSVYGGVGGKNFDDNLQMGVPPVIGIYSITVWNADILDGLQAEFVTLGGGVVLGDRHGEGKSNNETRIVFEQGEVIVAVNGTNRPSTVTQLSFTTKKEDGRMMTYGPYGKADLVTYSFSFFGLIAGFHGSADSYINTIGVYYVTV